MGQPRPKTRPKKSGEGPCAEDGPPPSLRSWQVPPDGLFDVIVPKLSPKQFVVVQLVCKDWNRSARYCLKDATPKRPDVDLSKLVTLYPNLTQLNLAHVEGLSTRMLAPLRRLTALRELCLSNVALQHHTNPDPLPAAAAVAAAPAPAATVAAERVVETSVNAGTQHDSLQPQPAALTRPAWAKRTRSRVSGAETRPAAGSPERLPGSRPEAGAADHAEPAQPDSMVTTETCGSPADTTLATVATMDSPPQRHKVARLGPEDRSPGSARACSSPADGADGVAACGSGGRLAGGDDGVGFSSLPPAAEGAAADAVGGAGSAAGAEGEGERSPDQVVAADVEAVGLGALVGMAQEPSPSPSSPPLSPASRIFGGLGDVLLRLSKLQADLCPALTAEAIACLPNLTDLTLDTVVAPDALAPLNRLRCLAVKKLANAEALDRLSGLTALLVNSDSTCASEFLPVCTRLPELQSLTFKTSSTKVLQQPDTLAWHGFSRLSSLDLRAPAECVKPGLPAVAELRALRSLSLDLYCASDEELMVTVVAPPNLESLFVSSDRSRSGGVIDVHPNPRLRSLRIRLYWTALNLVLPEGLPEPSPLPEPSLSDDEVAQVAYSLPLPERTGAGFQDRLGRVAAGGSPAGNARAAVGLTEQQEQEAHTTGSPAAAGPGRPARRGCRRRGSPGARTTNCAVAGGEGANSPEAERRTPGRAGRGAAGAAAGRVSEGMPGGRRDEGAASGGAGGDGGSGADDDSAGSGETPRSGGAARNAAMAAAAGETPDQGRGVGISSGGLSGQKADVDMPLPHEAMAGGGSAAGTPAASPCTPGRCTKRAGPLAGPPGGGVTVAQTAATPSGLQTPVHDARRGSAGGHVCGGLRSPTASAGAGGGCSFSTGRAAAGGGTGGVLPPEMELQDLCLDACFFLLYGSLVPVLRQFPKLTSLTLDNALALENGELTQLCELTSLREVSLSGLHLVTDSGLRALGRLSRLSSLRVRGLRKLAMHAAQAYMRQKPIVRRYEDVSGTFLSSLSALPDLRSLALKHLHNAGESALAAGLGPLTQLSRLEVKDVQSMSDTVLQSLTRHVGLQELSVLHCEAVTSRGRDAIVSSLGHRVALDFEGCSLPDITRPCALPTTSTQAQLIGDDRASLAPQPRRSCQHSNQH